MFRLHWAEAPGRAVRSFFAKAGWLHSHKPWEKDVLGNPQVKKPNQSNQVCWRHRWSTGAPSVLYHRDAAVNWLLECSVSCFPLLIWSYLFTSVNWLDYVTMSSNSALQGVQSPGFQQKRLQDQLSGRQAIRINQEALFNGFLVQERKEHRL